MGKTPTTLGSNSGVKGLRQGSGSATGFMTKTSFLRSFLALAAFLAAGQTALAQSPECQRFRAELAALDRGGGGASTGAMQAQRAEINRLVGYYRNIGCERGPLGFLSGPAPAQGRLPPWSYGSTCWSPEALLPGKAHGLFREPARRQPH